MPVLKLLIFFSSFFSDTENNYSLELKENISLEENKLSTSNRGPFSEFIFLDEYFVNYTTSPEIIILYDYEGKQKRTIGNQGEGPGEYTTVYDLFNKNHNIVAFSQGGRIIKFNLYGDVVEEYSYHGHDPLKAIIRDNVVYYIESDFLHENHIQYENLVSDEEGEFFRNLSREDIWLRVGHYGDNLTLSQGDCLVWVPPAQKIIYRSCQSVENFDKFEFESDLYRDDVLTATDDELIRDIETLNEFVTNRSAATRIFELDNKWVVELYHNHIPNMELILLDKDFEQLGNIILDEEFRDTYGGAVGSRDNTLYYYYEDQGEDQKLTKNLHGFRITKVWDY